MRRRSGSVVTSGGSARNSADSLAYNKPTLIDAAGTMNDLRVPPGNRLEKLTGDRAGQYTVRVNDQFRICFTWSAGGASNVEFVDYH